MTGNSKQRSIRPALLPLFLFLGAIVALAAGCATPRPAPGAASATLAGKVNPYDRMVVHVIDSGQGACHLVECPLGSPIMIDCGCSACAGTAPDRTVLAKNIRKYIANELADYTEADGSIQMEALMFSHGDRDHINLIPGVLPLSPAEAGQPPRPFYRFKKLFYTGSRTQYGAIKPYLDSIAKAGTQTFPPSDKGESYFTAGDAKAGRWPADANLLCGNPGKQQYTTILTMNADPKKNPGSMVLRLQNGGRSIILPGDAEGPTYQTVYDNYKLLGDPTTGTADSPALASTVLVAAHHGAETKESNDGWWAYVSNPNTVLFPAGTHMGYVHPRCTTAEVYDGNAIWRKEMSAQYDSCTDLNCQNVYRARATYAASLLNLSSYPIPPPAKAEHVVTCGLGPGRWKNATTAMSMFNVANAGTVQVRFDSGVSTYDLFCPCSTAPPTVHGAWSCLFEKRSNCP